MCAWAAGGRLHRRVEGNGIGILLRAPDIEHRRQVGAAAEPLAARHHHAGIHVDGRHMRVLHVGDQRDAARPEPRVLLGAGHLCPELRCELAMNGGDVNPHLFEHGAAHQAHDATASRRAGMIGALPRRSHEAPRGNASRRCAFALDLLENGADAIAQFGEPTGSKSLLAFDVGGQRCRRERGGAGRHERSLRFHGA